MRSWLNSEFLNTAFSSSEKSAIPTVNLSNPNNPNYGTAGGNDTKDQVFLLSLQEMQQYFNLSDTWTDYNGNNNDITGEIYYFGGSKDVITSPTAYAVAQGTHADSVYHDAEGKGSCFWWLRSPGYYGLDVAYVYYYGTVDASGYSVDFDSGAVRPALWFDNAQKGNTGPESSYSEKSSSQKLISEQEAMDIAYRTAKQEFGDVELADEDGNPVDGLNISYDVQHPVIYERDEKKHTVTVSILVMMKINGEGNSGTFQYYVVDMKTGNCSKEDMYE